MFGSQCSAFLAHQSLHGINIQLIMVCMGCCLQAACLRQSLAIVAMLHFAIAFSHDASQLDLLFVMLIIVMLPVMQPILM